MTNKFSLNLIKRKITISEASRFGIQFFNSDKYYFLKVKVKKLESLKKTRLSNFKFEKSFKISLTTKPHAGRRIKNRLSTKLFSRKLRAKSIYYKLNRRLSYFLHLKICSNNIFCVLRQKDKTIKICSSGKYNVKISKKTLRYNVKPVITFFLREIRTKILASRTFFLILTAPLRLRKQVLKFIFPKIFEDKKRRSFCVKVKEGKCFNGCRARKKKRRKQKKLRLFKE